MKDHLVHAEDRVDRRSYLVGHLGKELALCLVCEPLGLRDLAALLLVEGLILRTLLEVLNDRREGEECHDPGQYEEECQENVIGIDLEITCYEPCCFLIVRRCCKD